MALELRVQATVTTQLAYPTAPSSAVLRQYLLGYFSKWFEGQCLSTEENKKPLCSRVRNLNQAHRIACLGFVAQGMAKDFPQWNSCSLSFDTSDEMILLVDLLNVNFKRTIIDLPHNSESISSTFLRLYANGFQDEAKKWMEGLVSQIIHNPRHLSALIHIIEKCLEQNDETTPIILLERLKPAQADQLRMRVMNRIGQLPLILNHLATVSSFVLSFNDQELKKNYVLKLAVFLLSQERYPDIILLFNATTEPLKQLFPQFVDRAGQHRSLVVNFINQLNDATLRNECRNILQPWLEPEEENGPDDATNFKRLLGHPCELTRRAKFARTQ